MILWRNIETNPFKLFRFGPRFSPFLLYVRWKSGVTFVRRCFRDVLVVAFTGFSFSSKFSYFFVVFFLRGGC